ncbi:hypothetical protein KBD11_01570, partial [Candidatus Saccharibacteria bacterium]|nr:hypothetical protein [Candidatus Saccharibacteria bacterium]
TTFRQLIELGYEPTVIALQLSRRLRERLTESDETGADRNRTLAFLRSLLDVPASRNPEVLLEIILLDQTNPSQEESSSTEPVDMQPSRRNATEVETPSRAKPGKLLSQNSSVTDSTASPRDIRHPDPKIPPQQTVHQDPPVSHHEHPSKGETSTDLSVEELWQSVLGELKKTHNTLYGIARMARPSISGDILLLELSFGFHQKRLNEPRNLAILTSLVERYRDASTQIKFSLIASDQDHSKSSDPVATISNIFGGAELLD